MRVVLFLIAGLTLSAPVRAEDFTGFYAGVNAGYGFERDHKTRIPTVTGTPDAARADSGALPPSAAGALRSIDASRAGSRQGTTPPQ